MATLDIFAKNIIGNSPTVNRAVKDFTGTNGDRWIKINSPSGSGDSANFFIVKKLSLVDSTSVSNAIDTNSSIIFDNNGYLQVPNTAVNVSNPLVPNQTIDSINDEHKKQFRNPKSTGFSQSKNIIFSYNLKWILYRDVSDSNQIYILYNPMHRQNIKTYYDNMGYDGNIQNLIQQYTKTFTISPLNDEANRMAVFAEPTCACYNVDNCVNDSKGNYLSEPTRRLIRWNCACTGPACSYSKSADIKSSFLPKFRTDMLVGLGCDLNLSVCSIAINASKAGNINIENSKIQQECGINEVSAPTYAPTTQPSTTQPSNTQPSDTPPTEAPPTPSKLSSPLVIGGGISVIVIIAIIVTIFTLKKMTNRQLSSS